jgi:long-chain acyl-CoA synthetase
MRRETLNHILSAIVERDLPQVMTVRKEARLAAISVRELTLAVVNTTTALRDWGVKKGDRVAILSENRPEWAIADFACLRRGAVVVPIYSTLTAQQVAYILSDSGAKVAFVSTKTQLEKVLTIQNQPAVMQIVAMDESENEVAVHMRQIIGGSTGQELDAKDTEATITPDDLASIIYTSGTTGVPKGVKLTHGNLTSNMKHTLDGFDVGPGHQISFLPVALPLDARGPLRTLQARPSRRDPQRRYPAAPRVYLDLPSSYRLVMRSLEPRGP